MIGGAHEIFLFLLYDDRVKEELKLTQERLVLLRHKISQGKISYDYISDTLTKLGCRCIRPRVVLPCIVKDKNGRLFDEYTFVKMFFTKKLADKYGADYNRVIGLANANHSINRPLFKHLLKSRRAWIVLDNYILDGVWSYEPIELTFHREKIIQVRNMLASHIPVSENPKDILTYQRMYPADWVPELETENQSESSESHSTTI